MIAVEMGIIETTNMIIVELKKVITEMEDYDEEFVKVLNSVIEERKQKEQLELEKIKQKEQLELEERQCKNEIEFVLQEMRLENETQRRGADNNPYKWDRHFSYLLFVYWEVIVPLVCHLLNLHLSPFFKPSERSFDSIEIIMMWKKPIPVINYLQELKISMERTK